MKKIPGSINLPQPEDFRSEHTLNYIKIFEYLKNTLIVEADSLGLETHILILMARNSSSVGRFFALSIAAISLRNFPINQIIMTSRVHGQSSTSIWNYW